MHVRLEAVLVCSAVALQRVQRGGELVETSDGWSPVMACTRVPFAPLTHTKTRGMAAWGTPAKKYVLRC